MRNRVRQPTRGLEQQEALRRGFHISLRRGRRDRPTCRSPRTGRSIHTARESAAGHARARTARPLAREQHSHHHRAQGSKDGGGERQDANSDFGRKYKLDEKELGTGAFSTVVLATSKAEGAQKVAVKCIRKTPDLKKEDVDSLHEEVAVLRSVEHPNIVKLHDFFEEKKMYYMVIELMEGGELFERIVKKTFYNEMDARGLVRILLDALAYLHGRGIVHRDLKPENLLLKSPFNDFDIKLADFGFAKKVEGKSLDTQCGTPGYVAPEILKGKKYGTAVDMWSCGVIIYILLGGYPPFHDDNHAILYRKIKAADYAFDPQYWDQVSDDAKDLIRKMLVVDPDKRLTASQALRHPWFLVGDHELVSRNLVKTLDTMRKFNARRKFRGTVKGIILSNKLAKGTLF